MVSQKDYTPEGFLAELQDVSDMETQQLLLLKALKPWGYDIFEFSIVPTEHRNTCIPKFRISNAADQWQRRYLSSNYEHHDWRVWHCQKKNTPLLWSEADQQGFAGRSQQLLSELRSHGYVVGVTLPLTIQWSPYRFSVSLCVSDIDDHVEHDKQFEQDCEIIKLIAQIFATQFDISSYINKQYKIRKKNFDAMNLLLQGHNRARIAELLDSTVPAVKHHLGAVQKKLGVGSAEQAVALIVALGLGDIGYNLDED